MRGVASIGQVVPTRQEQRLIGAEERHQIRHFLRLAHAPERVQAAEGRLGRFVQPTSNKRRCDKIRADGVDAYALLGVLQRSAFGQTDHAMLCRDVGRRIGKPDGTKDRRHVDNRAAALSKTVKYNRSRARSGRLQRSGLRYQPGIWRNSTFLLHFISEDM